MPLAIEMPDGSLIADGDWERMDDVMRAAHGHGVNRMPGKLVEVDAQFRVLQDAIIETTRAMENFAMRVKHVPEEGRCEFSDLFWSQCAHCLGHEPDWETKPKVKVYD